MIDLAGKNVLVTGATGLLGRPLVDGLIERGANVFSCGFEPLPLDYPLKATYAQLDMGDREQFGNLLEDIEYVFHLAGAKGGVGIGQSKAADFMRGNILSAVNLYHEIVAELSFDHHVRRVLFVSSVGAYPGDLAIFSEQDDIWRGAPHQSDFFGGVAKRVGETLCEAHRQQYGIDCVIVRPTNCFGPFDRFDPETGMVIAALIARIEAGERPLKVWGSGATWRDFLYSKDAAEQMILVMEHGASGGAYNLGTGRAFTLENVLYWLQEVYPDLTWEFDANRPSGPSIRKMDMTKFRSEIGLLPRTNMRQALEETVEWYRANKDYQKYDPFRSQMCK